MPGADANPSNKDLRIGRGDPEIGRVQEAGIYILLLRKRFVTKMLAANIAVLGGSLAAFAVGFF